MTKEPENKEGAEGQEPKEKLLPQSAVDAIVQDRLARERSKYSDYDDLRKFKIEHEKNLEAATQKELEAKKEYEKLKEVWTKKEQELLGLVSKKDTEISDMKIVSALMQEISKQNAYPEETIALIKSQTVLDKEGNIRIKGRDANGLEVLHSVEEGIKSFLTQRPHLVKVTQKNGGGTGTGSQPGAGQESNDLETLNAELQSAINRGDRKKAVEVKAKLGAIVASQKTKL